MRYAAASLAASALVFGCCLGSGCTRAPSDPPAAAPTSVTVSYPVEREVTNYADFTARTAAVDCVEVRARVWGYLKKVNFKEGALVKKGDVLFELDPRPYEAEHARCLADLNSAQAHLTRTLADFKRAGELLPKKAIAQSDYDLAKGDCDEAAAAVKVAEATLNTAELNLEFTRITAPVSGRVSRVHGHGGQLDSVGGPGQRHPAHNDRVRGPDVRLFRCRRAHRAARPPVDPQRRRPRRPAKSPCP